MYIRTISVLIGYYIISVLLIVQADKNGAIPGRSSSGAQTSRELLIQMQI